MSLTTTSRRAALDGRERLAHRRHRRHLRPAAFEDGRDRLARVRLVVEDQDAQAAQVRQG